MAGASDEYVCTLDEASLAVAKKELNEDEKNRDGAVAAFKEWVVQQKWLTSPTDYSFLLRFLRTKKYSQLEARKTLENFWKKRTHNSAWYANKDVNDPKILAVLKTGCLLKLPNPDKHGRIWCIDRPGCLDIDWLMKKVGVDMTFKTYSLVFDWLMMDERVQVNGVCWLVDCTGIGMKHNTKLYTPSNGKKFMDLVQGVYPTRNKEVNFYNISPIVEMIISSTSAFMKEKTKQRLKFHGKSLVSFYENVDMSVLPLDYLPDSYTGPNSGTVAEIVDYMIKELSSDSVSGFVDSLSNGNYGVDMKAKPDDLPTESFRKLNVD